MRRHNSALVLDAVAGEPGVSRAGVAARTGLAKATVSVLVDQLIAAGLLTDSKPAPRAGRGRPGTGLSLAPRGPHGLGVEIGVGWLATCLVDLTGTMHAHRVVPADNRMLSQRQVWSTTAQAVRDAQRDAQARGVPVGGVGIALPGLVTVSGTLRSAPNLGWRDVDVRAELAARLDLGSMPVLVGNEANFAASAEALSGEDRDFVHVSGETGIGAGIVVDGELVPGVRGFAGEIGHVCVDPDGPRCACGAQGCLETLAGQEIILRSAGISTEDSSPASLIATLVERLTAGEAAAVEAVCSAGRWLGVALAAVINVVDIPTVVLGGNYAALEPWLADSLRAELATRVISSAWAPVAVRRSTLGSEAAVRGAAFAVIHGIMADPTTRACAPPRG